MTTEKNIAEQALENLVNKPKQAETAEGSYTTHSVSDLIKLDEHLAKKKAAETGLRAPFGIRSAVCKPGRNYG